MNLIVYYSRAGNVKKVAQSYVERYGGDMVEIVSKRDYSGTVGFIRACVAAIRKRSPIIEPLQIDFSKYDKVVVCGAVWAGTIASPVRTFLKKYGSRFNAVEYIITRGDKQNKYEAVFDEMDALCGQTRVQATSLANGELI